MGEAIWRPQPRQQAFLERPEYEVLYGGSAGGGKSDALLIEVLRQIHIPHYKAIIFRKTYPQLAELVDRSRMLYPQIYKGCVYNSTSHCWTFPSGAKVYFGSLPHEASRHQYAGRQFDVICFDELTHFTFTEYMFMLSRNRPAGEGTECYVRCATNPGSIGHAWVKERWKIGAVQPMTTIWEKLDVTDNKGQVQTIYRDRIFVPATVFDNQELLKNNPNYLGSLAMMPQAERDALLYGSWTSFEGQVFTEWKDDPSHYDDMVYTHVINPFRIPKEWKVIRSMDFGYTRPSAIYWTAISPERVKYVIREFYTSTGEPNVGSKMHHIDIAKKIVEIEESDPNLRGRKIIGICDPSMFDSSRGVSVADDMSKAPYYVSWTGGDNTRLAGKMQVHYHLAFEDDGTTMLQVFKTCKNLIRTLPNLTYDQSNVEDINSDLEDHAYDSIRYMLMENPITPRGNKLRELPEFDPLNQWHDNKVTTFRHF